MLASLLGGLHSMAMKTLTPLRTRPPQQEPCTQLKQPAMDQLPDEIVACILGFLDVQCAYNAGRTCKRMYRLLSNVASEVAGGWQHVPKMRPGGEAALKRLAFVVRRGLQLAGFPYSGLLTLHLRGFSEPAFDAVHVSVSELKDDSHALALDPDGRVWSMGSNTFGGLGREGGDAFLPVSGLPGTARSVTIYYGTSAAVLSNGELWAWGRNATRDKAVPGRQQPIYPFPIRLSVPEPVVQVALGSSHALALTRDGNVYGLGDNACYELGIPRPTTKEHFHHSSFTLMRTRGRAVKVAAGGLCSLLLMCTGQLYACGSELRGELGRGEGTRSLPRLTILFEHLGPLLDVEARHTSTAVITRKGQLYVCGYDCVGWEHSSPTLVVEADEPIISCALTNSFGVCFKTASGRVGRYTGSPASA